MDEKIEGDICTGMPGITCASLWRFALARSRTGARGATKMLHMIVSGGSKRAMGKLGFQKAGWYANYGTELSSYIIKEV